MYEMSFFKTNFRTFALLMKFTKINRFGCTKQKFLFPVLLEIDEETVHEVARRDKNNCLKKSANRKAQISKAFVQLTELIWALQPADFLG